MSTNTQRLLAAMGILLALGGVGAAESYLPATAFWVSVAVLLLLLALWQYRARWYLSRQGNLELTAVEFEAAKPTAFLWLGAYFSLTLGFFALVATSWYYQFAIPAGVFLTFFATWWIKLDLWALLLNRARKASRIDRALIPEDAVHEQ